MGEASAKAWLIETFGVSRGTLARIEAFFDLLKAENAKQNLVSASSLDRFWSRHIADSAQLLLFGQGEGEWVDLGSGAGFPGLIIALLRSGAVTLIEQRRLRVDFLRLGAECLGIEGKVRILAGNASQLPPADFAYVSARAFAPLERIFAIAGHLAAPTTKWILPKGKNAKSELEAALASWQGEFSLEASVTDPDAYIVVAEQLRRRPKGKRRR
jgi:16S rRNA (guanine527-N7)-methyltransferase